MIPAILSPPEENNARQPNVFAYVSVQDENAQDNRPKPRRGQIRKCNLTNYHAISNHILKEVKFDGSCLLQVFLLLKFSCYFVNNNARIVEIYDAHLNGHVRSIHLSIVDLAGKFEKLEDC